MKKLLLKAAVAAAALSLTAGAAQAAVTVTVGPSITYAQDVIATPDSAIVWDFDTIAVAGYDFSFVAPSSEENPLPSDLPFSAPPPGDPTDYASIKPGDGSKGIFTFDDPLQNFSIFMGSPDTYNVVSFFTSGGLYQTLVGSAIVGGVNYAGDQSVGKRVTFNFNGAAIERVEFTSTQHSFEFDRIAAVAVPEPATWAMMLMGFFGVGSLVRSRRSRTAVA